MQSHPITVFSAHKYQMLNLWQLVAQLQEEEMIAIINIYVKNAFNDLY
jgi:hypothetical protein